MSIFNDNIVNGHPFDGVQKMSPIEGLNYVFKTLTGEDFNDAVYQYKRHKTDKNGFITDIRYTIDIVQQFHPEVYIGIRLCHKLHQSRYYIGSDKTTQREFPDEEPIFMMFYYEWNIINIKI